RAATVWIGAGAQRRIDEVATGRLQAPAADPGGDRGLLVLEQPVQIAGGDVVRGGDARGRELRLVQVLLDELLDT
ncbi:hypothetical protein ABT363_42715, partial [Streptomyces sp. NPDC000188]